MRRVRLARLRADQAQPVAVNGQPAIAGAAAIATFLRANGAPGLDGFLAQPQPSADGSEIDWYTSHPGTAVPLSALNGNDRLAVEERLAIRLGQLKALAEAGDTPADMKQLLQAAINYPGPDQVYAVGREPVLVMWGHRGAQAAAAVPPTATPAAAASAGTAAAGRAAAGTAAAAETVAARSPWRRWLLLGLLALLLLAALLTLGYCWRREAVEPPPAPVAEPPAPQIDPDLVKELEQETDRADDLRKQLATLQQQFDDKLKQCPAEQPAPQPEPQVTPPEPPKVEEPKPEPPKAEVKPAPKPEPKPEPPKKAEKPPKKEPPKEPPKQQAAVLPPVPAEPSKSQCQKLVPQRKKWEAPEVVFVVDASGSMEDRVGGQTRLDAAKDSVSFIADHLPSDIDTALVKFTDCNAVDNDYFLNRSQLKQKVNQLQPSGGTPLARSIERAARIISPTKETVIVVVTDGDDTCKQKDPCQVAAAAKASHPNLTINVVDVSGQGLGSCIARNGGGRVLPANTPLEIQKAIKDATNQVMLPTSCVEGN